MYTIVELKDSLIKDELSDFDKKIKTIEPILSESQRIELNDLLREARRQNGNFNISNWKDRVLVFLNGLAKPEFYTINLSRDAKNNPIYQEFLFLDRNVELETFYQKFDDWNKPKQNLPFINVVWADALDWPHQLIERIFLQRGAIQFEAFKTIEIAKIDFVAGEILRKLKELYLYPELSAWHAFWTKISEVYSNQFPLWNIWFSEPINASDLNNVLKQIHEFFSVKLEKGNPPVILVSAFKKDMEHKPPMDLKNDPKKINFWPWKRQKIVENDQVMPSEEIYCPELIACCWKELARITAHHLASFETKKKTSIVYELEDETHLDHLWKNHKFRLEFDKIINNDTDR